MQTGISKNKLAVAVAAALSAIPLSVASDAASAAKVGGTYVAGDFHNHTTCSDGSTSMQQLVKKSTDKVDTPFGLDWFVQAGHGGNGNRNCTLVEDETLSTPAYPFVAGQGPQTTWAASIGNSAVKGNAANGGAALSTQANPAMWRWQSVQEFQYPLMEYLYALKGVPLFLGLESVVAGHEHASMSVITGQMPEAIFTKPLPSSGGYQALGNATAFAQWTYCFDRGDSDWSRGNQSIANPVGNNWDCSVTGSANSADPSWNATARKLVPIAPTGTNGHLKTVEAMKWMKEFHAKASYYVPAHLERAGTFNPNGNNGFNIEHLRNFNNAAPDSAFGFESQPGHHASGQRGEYQFRRNGAFASGGPRVDSVGGTTYGGTGVYAAQIGGVWDALLGEGRNWWFFGNSDWHSRRGFGTHDRRTTGDFFPGEYQRNYTMVRNAGNPKLSPQMIVDGLRSGNTFVATGQLIDRLAFVACIGNPAAHGRSNQAVQTLALNAALNNTDLDFAGCATMGEKLVVPPGADVVVSIVVRDPSGTNYSPYTFSNPSLAQVGISQPLNAPVLDHVDVIRGLVTGYKSPGAADYTGEWPRNWLNPATGETLGLGAVPAGAKNTSAAVIKTFNDATWTTPARDPQYKLMTFRIADVRSSQYVRVRGTNLPPNVPFETDADGNPLPDMWTNPESIPASTPTAGDSIAENASLRIPCLAAGTNVPSNDVTHTGTIDGCPNHLPVKDGTRYVAYDVAAWADLWFYGNPIFIEVKGSTLVAGVK